MSKNLKSTGQVRPSYRTKAERKANAAALVESIQAHAAAAAAAGQTDWAAFHASRLPAAAAALARLSR